jgi:uncharacterized protein YjeT (DUF2065 family)
LWYNLAFIKGGYMVVFVKLFGIFIIIAGTLFSARLPLLRKVLEFGKVGNHIYFAGAARIIIGILLLVATKHVAVPLIPGTIGMLALIAGIVICYFGPKKMVPFLDKILAYPDEKLRVFPPIAVFVGILLLFSV